MRAILLIGGLGTRLRPFTLTTPKPLLPILNRPFLSYQIKHIRSYGIRDIVLCTAYHPEAFQRVFGRGQWEGVRLRYVHEKTPLGTGGAIKNAERHVQGTTLICNGDILIDFDIAEFARFHRRQKALASILLTRVKDPTAYGLVETDEKGRIRHFREKPSPGEITCDTINAGAYLFEPEAFTLIPKGIPSSVERELFPRLLKLGRPLFGKIISGYWLDIGTLEKYRQAHDDLLAGVYPTRIPGRKRGTSTWMEKNARVGEGVSFKGRVLVGEGTTIGPQAQVEGPTVIGRHCRLGRGVSIRHSILMDSVRIDDGARLENVIVGPHAHIGSHSTVLDSALGGGSRITDYSCYNSRS